MQSGHVTTPFGRRPMTLALVKHQVQAADTKTEKKADKWNVFRDVCEARERLGLQDRSLAVLDALLSFYPTNELSSDVKMVVFPSNAQLSVRAHGIAGATLRRHIAFLVEAGLIVRKDSANGKRYARKDKTGEIDTAFGFDLSPLLARAGELANLAQQVVADRAVFRRAKEDLTILRRDVRKLITAAIEEGAQGDWSVIEAAYIGIVARIPRSPDKTSIDAILDEMSLLHEEIVKRLDIQGELLNMSTNDAQNERHIQNSNTESTIEYEPSSGNELGERPSEKSGRIGEPLKSYPLGLVLRACPEMAGYGQGGAIASWRELMAAAVTVRSMLGVSPSAYQDACDAMGPENAAVAIACILERAGHINSAGGYLRDLTAKAWRGEFSLGPMLMALLRGRSSEKSHAAG
ncbi:plasmid replication protein RepC [Rhizobium sp. WYJ-E13]|uniref:plasmid replication protein RepC n=1 Tax=Rhizobium sp. WYJ-E13 TaxID=2849093 RepID=UPI001C1EA776|nr:plasmid replication protein RepC [Rhizobium sp. WYJ-E13]QWW72321.1 replication initiation protein RepC [Rhizobium sp. WYJ-E13]